ncbi:transposase [Streptomyces avermitilis]|uniref:transposase n=1 Tax=Streptomyces avermitilis TaxID=33903 RepID=UPI0036AD275A
MVPPPSRGVLPTDASTQFDCAQHNCVPSHAPRTDVGASIDPAAWVIDDVPVPKGGRMSAGVALQGCGALGKRATDRRGLTRIPVDVTPPRSGVWPWTCSTHPPAGT